RFTPALRSIPRHFRTRSVERFYHNSSHRSPKFTILDVLESRLDGASKLSIICSCYFSDLGRKTHYNNNTMEKMMIRSHNFLRGHASYLLLEQTNFFSKNI